MRGYHAARNLSVQAPAKRLRGTNPFPPSAIWTSSIASATKQWTATATPAPLGYRQLTGPASTETVSGGFHRCWCRRERVSRSSSSAASPEGEEREVDGLVLFELGGWEVTERLV